jgi:hypothetical protein
MKTLLTLLLATLCAASGYGQTLKSVMIDTNGVQVNQFGNGSASNTAIKLGGTNWGFWQATGPDRILLSIGGATGATFTSNSITTATFSGNLSGGVTIGAGQSISFSGGANVSGTRTNLGLGATWLTNTDVTNFRAAIGLGATNDAVFNIVEAGALRFGTNIIFGIDDAMFYVAPNFNSTNIAAATRTNLGLGKFSVSDDDIAGIFGETKTALQVDGDDLQINVPISFFGTNTASTTRTNLELGATKPAGFRGLTSDGNIVITNQTATNNGILFIYRTNNEPFLGLANLIASNNTTISNETLVRVGTAEATNRSAQFGFRSTNTNGSGVAVFSVFGYNALMQIGADASTNAVIFSGGGTNNEVMTLIRDGATEFARPIRFSTNASTRPATNAPANTTNVAAWVEMRIGTNSYRVPLYQ